MAKTKKEKYFTKSINIPISLKEMLENQAKKENRDLNNMIITILLTYFEKNKKFI